MNERMIELARQSGGIDMTNHVAGGITIWIGTGTPEFLERFAELIVQECVNVVDDMADPEDSERYFWAIQNVSQKIKQHFGVDG